MALQTAGHPLCVQSITNALADAAGREKSPRTLDLSYPYGRRTFNTNFNVPLCDIGAALLRVSCNIHAVNVKKQKKDVWNLVNDRGEKFSSLFENPIQAVAYFVKSRNVNVRVWLATDGANCNCCPRLQFIAPGVALAPNAKTFDAFDILWFPSANGLATSATASEFVPLRPLRPRR
jgi:hypothetical protein